MRYPHLKFIIIPVLALCMFTSAAPKAHALLGDLLGGLTGGETVRIISDVSQPSITTALQTTLSRLLGEDTSDLLARLLFKEEVMDPAAWAASKQFQQQLTGEMLRWLGGQQPGQNGQVQFIQNRGEYLQNEVVDSVAGTYLYVDRAGDTGQCSEEHAHRVLAAASNAYLADRQAALQGGALQCGGDTDDYESDLDRILGDFLECRDETCAYFASRQELASRITKAIEDEQDVIRDTRGMLPQRICTVVNDPDGRPRQLCELVSPPTFADEAASFHAIQLPGLQMLNMDEFNEIGSNLMNNLTNLVTQGVTGVLGLSGNPNYSQNVFGPDGALSYVDALIQEDITNYQSGGGGAGGGFLATALGVETRYLGLQQEILTEISSLEDRLASNRQEFPGCFDMELTSDLLNARTTATAEASSTLGNITDLNEMQQRYESGDASTRNVIVNEFNQLRIQRPLHTESQIRSLDLTYIGVTFAQMVDRFEYDMASERQSCGGSFDYDGVLTS